MKALVGKVVDLGTSMKENLDQTRKVTEHLEMVKGINERMTGQEQRVEELIRKECEVIDEIRKVAEKIDLPSEKIEALQQDLKDHRQLFEKPLDKTVHYRHYVGRVVWVLLGMAIVTVSAVSVAIRQWGRARDYAVDEVRWRYVSLSTDSVVSVVVQRAQDRGLVDPETFAREVEQEENRRAELTKNMIRAQTAQQQIEELKQQKRLH